MCMHMMTVGDLVIQRSWITDHTTSLLLPATPLCYCGALQGLILVRKTDWNNSAGSGSTSEEHG